MSIKKRRKRDKQIIGGRTKTIHQLSLEGWCVYMLRNTKTTALTNCKLYLTILCKPVKSAANKVKAYQQGNRFEVLTTCR